jgi:hypothetical protein
MEQAIYNKLQAVARAHKLTNYTEMGALVGLDPHDSRLWAMLDEINRFEYENKRPMISALVISKEENRPGSGFWVCASDLGKFNKGDDEDIFWSNELRSVWDYWASH